MRFAALFLALLCSAAIADDAAFREAAAVQYRAMLAAMSAKGTLDNDAILLERVRRIGAGLVAAAGTARPETSGWAWEIHVTSDPSRAAFCMAGGKVMVGRAFVAQLALTDGELAMLLGHEIAHAVADHRREASRATMESDPAAEIRDASIAVMQENEADRIGMELALRAGWPAASLLGFFDKLAAREPAGTFNSTHASAAARAEAARAMARSLGAAPQ
jgi:predicted Zn-dependent protease